MAPQNDSKYSLLASSLAKGKPAWYRSATDSKTSIGASATTPSSAPLPPALATVLATAPAPTSPAALRLASSSNTVLPTSLVPSLPTPSANLSTKYPSGAVIAAVALAARGSNSFANFFSSA